MHKHLYICNVIIIYVHLGSFVVWEKTRWTNFQTPVTCRACSIIAACSMTSRKWSMATWMLLMLLLSLFEHDFNDFHGNFTFSHMITQDESRCFSFLRQHILDTKVTLRVWHIGPRPFDLDFFVVRAHHSPTNNSSQKSPDLQLKWLIADLVSDIQE